MKKTDKRFYDIFLRYFALVLVALPGMDLFYFLFSPLTTYPVFWGLLASYKAVLLNNSIFIGPKIIEIVGACVAGSAYYLLLILNLATPKISWKRRLAALAFSWGAFLIINILRIYFLSLMYLNGSQLFDITHKVFWYLGSTIFLVAIWFLTVKVFKFKHTPFYEDLRFIYRQSSFAKAKKKRKIAVHRIGKSSKN